MRAVGWFAVVWLGLTARFAEADAIAPPSILERFAAADAVVLVRVTAIEEKDVETVADPGAQRKVQYRIAIVTILEGVQAPKEAKSLRVGFAPRLVDERGKVAPQLPGRGVRLLQVGQEALLYLTKHFRDDFFIAPMYFQITDRQQPGFARELELTKHYAKLLQKPHESLQSKDANERLTTAALLVTRYRTPRGSSQVQEPIDAAESKLILAALHDADWSMQAKREGETPHPFPILMKLGLVGKDGFTPPRGGGLQGFHEAARAWLKQHRDSYRIQRFVAATK